MCCSEIPLSPVLENLTFHSSNRFQPIIEALAFIKQHIRTSYKYFPVDVPIEGIVTEIWMSMVIENVGGQKKVNVNIMKSVCYNNWNAR